MMFMAIDMYPYYFYLLVKFINKCYNKQYKVQFCFKHLQYIPCFAFYFIFTPSEKKNL